jgi:hypothetical protein
MACKDGVTNDYFNWLCSIVSDDDLPEQMSFNKLLVYLHRTKFKYTIRKDQNRAEDGKSLRWRYICNIDYQGDRDELLRRLGGSCSVLEMMIALAMRCEEVMDEPRIGNRTSQWFWGMIVNLGLGSLTDTRYDKQYVEETVSRFLKREYEPNGKGGLFTIRDCDQDLRTVEIWFQLCWYLDSIA